MKERTYYDEGRDACYYEHLGDEEFAWAATKMSQDLADMDTRGLEDILPFVAVIGEAARRVERLVAENRELRELAFS